MDREDCVHISVMRFIKVISAYPDVLSRSAGIHSDHQLRVLGSA